MRLAPAGIIALMLGGGCLRFGYDHVPGQTKQMDAAVRDASSGASNTDAAAALDAAAPDGAANAGDASYAGDAGRIRDAAVSGQDAALDAAPSGGGMDAATADASGMDAATTDAGGMDAAIVEAGAGVDAAIGGVQPDWCLAHSEQPLCNGFEDGLGSCGSTTFTNATIDPTSLRVHSGSGAVHLVTGTASSSTKSARCQTTAFSGVTSGDVWARAFFYLPSTTSVSAALETLRITEQQPPFSGCSLVIRSQYLELSGVTTRFRALSPFPTDRWTCVELRIAIDASAGVCEGYVDSMIATQSPQVDTLPASGYGDVSFGVTYTDATQGAVELYVDDLVASTARVGCL